MSDLLDRFSSKLKIFSHDQEERDDEEAGDSIDTTTVAGGGHAGRSTTIKHQLRVSHALKLFLIHHRAISEAQGLLDGGPDDLSPELREIVERPHVYVSPELTDRSHSLASYFISSSHNTYLLAHQLYGGASPEAYKTTLRAGARCVEIDAWDNSDNKAEPKVTHGYTLTSHIPFRAVCEAVRDVVDEEAAEARDEQGYRPAPILISLENHCGAEGQLRLVDIMKEVWGDRLLSKAVRDKGSDEQDGSGDHVKLSDLGSKIALIVEYHFPGIIPKSDNEKEEEAQAPPSVITPELAELGVYAQSVKPPNDSWLRNGIVDNAPHNPLINVSESQLSSLFQPVTNKALITQHNAHHLMRVYPKGTRISSANLRPTDYWDVGAQICALNWQTFGASLQLNEALFTGTDGFVLKPSSMRYDPASPSQPLSAPRVSRAKLLRLHIGGASDIPIPKDREVHSLRPYVSCLLVSPNHEEPLKRKTKPYKQHKLGLIHKDHESPPSDPLWQETLEWPLDEKDKEMSFLRILVKDDEAFAANPILAVNAVRLVYARPEWVFIRLLDLKGRETRCSICVKIEIVDAE